MNHCKGPPGARQTGYLAPFGPVFIVLWAMPRILSTEMVEDLMVCIIFQYRLECHKMTNHQIDLSIPIIKYILSI